VLGEYWDERYDGEWSAQRIEAMSLLEEEAQLREVVRLVGIDALSREERLILETAKSIRRTSSIRTPFMKSIPMLPWISSLGCCAIF